MKRTIFVLLMLALTTLALVVSPLSASRAFAAEPPPEFKLSWGGLGSAPGQFNAIQGIAIDAQHNVYVADQQNNRIQKFTADGTYLTQWYAYLPLDVAVDANGVVYVTEWDHTIRKYDANGTFLGVFAQFDDARSVAFDAAGNVYAVNSHFGMVHKYAPDGTLLTSWSAAPFPVGIAVDAGGNIYVTTDRGGGPILKFAPDGTQTASFGFHAYKIAFGADGNLYGADPAGNRVQKFTTDGTLLSEWGTLGTGDGEFTSPAAIAVAPNGDVYVGELVTTPDNPRVQVFTYNVLVYNFTGFFQPIDNLPVVNTVNAGRAIPVKFSLGGDQGLNIFEAGYPKSQKIACDSTAPLDSLEETVTAGSSSLSYDASTDTYTYIWKTEKAWAGQCRQLVVKLKDGTFHRANFQLK